MGSDVALRFYSRDDILNEMLRISKGREVAARFGEQFGKRPDAVQFKGDILDFIKNGATSIHISEERWSDPFQLKAGMTKRELDELRSGWDLIIDIDSDEFSDSRVAAKLIIDALKFHNIKSISCKYSGNTGFHIAVPFEAFPDRVNGQEIRLLFPDGLRYIASYLKSLIKEPLEQKIGTNPFSKVDIDTVLISSRHMFRCPYSFHEKTGFVSVPVDINSIDKFNINDAKPENVKVSIKFLDMDNAIKGEAKHLLINALEFSQKEVKEKSTKVYEIPKNAVEEKYFPPCIKIGLNGLEDGRKRFLFILANFLGSLGWNANDIEKKIEDWNKKNKEPLKEGYIKAQISWFKKQNSFKLPPNCNNNAYYTNFGICQPDGLCRLIKNPANYSRRKVNLEKENLKGSKNNRK